MNENIDIIALLENNPLTRLNRDYGSRIIEKIQKKFKPEDQQMFIGNLYCYLNYNLKKDFIISLDNIWKWLGYGRIDHCKTALTKNFVENVDYKIVKVTKDNNVTENGKNLGGAGLNREYITLTLHCFEKLSLKSRTEKSDYICDHFIELKHIMYDSVCEESTELYNKLKDKDNQIEDIKKLSVIELQRLEENLITNSTGKFVVYLGLVGDNIVKFGNSKIIDQRVRQHKTDFGQFTLKYTLICNNHIQIEDCIKKELNREGSVLYGRKKEIEYNNKMQTELIKLDSKFTIEKLYEEIKRLKDLCEVDLINKLIEENEKLKKLKKNNRTVISEIIEEEESEENKKNEEEYF